MSFFKNKNQVDFITLPTPDDTISFFKAIRNLSEQYWAISQPKKNIYGFQIQENTEWKTGLSDSDIQRFQNAIGFSFPEPLRNFYKEMNGLNKPGINLLGSDDTKPTFNPVFYSYPDDVDEIKNLIKWIYEANGVVDSDISHSNISRIFPVCWHRFMLIDIPGNPILSMNGNDIIYWADDISKLLANELFENIDNVYDFESVNYPNNNINFWLD